MLIIGSSLIGSPVMSLQTGGKLAETVKAVIDPSNLRVIAYQVDGPLLSERPSFLRTNEIREYGRLGMIIDGNHELVGLNDVIRLKQIHDLHFDLIGLSVVDDHGKRLGKVEDFTLETGDFVIQQLSVKRGLLRSLTDTGLLINRSQIVEVNDTTVVVRSPSVKAADPVMQAVRGDYVNPFRTAKPPAEAANRH